MVIYKNVHIGEKIQAGGLKNGLLRLWNQIELNILILFNIFYKNKFPNLLAKKIFRSF